MKKILTVCVMVSLCNGCATWDNLVKREKSPDELPLIVGGEEIASIENEDAAVKDGKIFEGMTSEMVEKSWGIPDNKQLTETEFVIWQYGRNKLYFLEDVLISWEKR